MYLGLKLLDIVLVDFCCGISVRLVSALSFSLVCVLYVSFAEWTVRTLRGG